MTVDRARAAARVALFERYRGQRAETWIEATGTSMTPLIQPGDRLLVAFGARPDHTGQVILALVDGSFVAHRLVAHRLVVGEGGRPSLRLTAKGDAEAFPDRSVSPADVFGVVRSIRRVDGRVTTIGLDDTPGAILARISWWSGCAARVSRRVARRAPARTGPPLMTVLLTLTRVPTRLTTALMPWLAQETRAEGR